VAGFWDGVADAAENVNQSLFEDVYAEFEHILQ
jgi:hypothetical protein